MPAAPRRAGSVPRPLVAIALLAFVLLTAGARPAATRAAFNAGTSNATNTFANLVVQPPTQSAASSRASGTVRVSWTASPTAVTESVTYLIYRRPAGSGAYSLLTPSGVCGPIYDDTPSADGSYDYVVKANVTSFQSADNNAVTALSDRTAPSTSATCDGTFCESGWYTAAVSVTLAATDGGTGVATIAQMVDGSTTTTSGSSSSFTVNGDSTGHAVSYYATDVAGNVAASQSLTLKIDATAPTAASGLAASTGSSSGTIDLSWTAGTDTTSGVAGYTVRYVSSKTCPTASTAKYPNTTSVGAVTSTTVTQLSSAKLYCFYLVTLDSAGNQSGASNVASATAKLPPGQ